MKISLARFQPIIEFLRPHAARIQAVAQKLWQNIQEHPRYIRAFSALPLLLNWFVGLHHEPYRSAAYRGFLLSAMFFIASSVLYFVFDNLRVYFASTFVFQSIFLLLQTAISGAYVVVSARLAYAEYREQPVHADFLDRLKDRMIEWI